jgi:fatty acid desaturase
MRLHNAPGVALRTRDEYITAHMFRHAADRLPIALILSLFAVDLSVYAWVNNVWLVLAYGLLSMLPKAGVCAFNHHHQHVSTFTSPVLNRAMEFVFALQTGVTSQTWVLHHSLGHHLNYLDQTKDESRWARDDGTRMGEMEYSFVTTLTSYGRAWKTGEKYPKQRQLFFVMGALTVALVSALVWYRPLQGAWLFVFVPAVMIFGTAMATYTHHSNRQTDDHFVACNNILQPFYNKLTGNLGYHTAHHYKPGVHWSKLPELHDEIKHKIPADAFQEPGIPWKYFGKSEGAVAQDFSMKHPVG